MTTLQFTTYPGLGEWAKENLHYSQAVRVGNIVKISGQDLATEIDQAFANVELALKAAGGKGWSQVYSVRSYHIPAGEAATDAMVRNLKQWCGPDHRPIWTEVGVTSLGLEPMRVEIEVEALIEG